MVISPVQGAIASLFFSVTYAWASAHYVDVNSTNPVAPFLDWGTAASTIQDAINASAPGEVVWVTNGVYSSGGKMIYGGLTNRVALDKPITVQSVNGPLATAIQGAWDPATTNGPLAVRCAWLTNAAVLAGFTLQGGATLASGFPNFVQSGGGSWCNAASAILSNCIFQGNAAAGPYGSGAYQGTLKNCFLHGNVSSPFSPTTYSCVLSSCTVSGNFGVGTSGGSSTNSIIYQNSGQNYSLGTFAFCCTTPLPSGPGNISSDPQLLPDGFHLASTSPCRGAGSNLVSATDISGQPWANPPSIGCKEWSPEPRIIVQPQISLLSSPVGFSLSLRVAGQEPFTCFWSRDGLLLGDDGHYGATATTTLTATGVNLQDAGDYRVVVSNAFAVATSAVTRVVVHCVDAQGSGPAAPYSDWSSAATNMQDAIDAAAPGEFVLVTNGLYSAGGKVMAGDLTNRIAVDKAVLVTSVNGPTWTTIQGTWDPVTTNGPLAVRCAWLTNGAVLAGFTLQGGGTRNVGDLGQMQSGGGIWGATNARVANCFLRTNNAAYGGGGCYQGQLQHCVLVANSSQSGGGAYQSALANCLLQTNAASLSAGGAFGGWITNCTLTGNTAPFSPAGVGSARVFNSIIYNNYAGRLVPTMANVDSTSILQNSCSDYILRGADNLAADPQLLDGIHLTSTSPCRGAGSTNFVSGVDIDCEPWATPPSMGCDEYVEAGITGPLAVSASAMGPYAVAGKPFLCLAQVTGRASRAQWSFGDGSALTNVSVLVVWRTWTNVGDYTTTFTAFNTDNPAGVSTNLTVHVVPLAVPMISAGAYSTNGFSVSFPSQYGILYYVEQATNLAPPVSWQSVSTWAGTGKPLLLNVPGGPSEAGFYRVRIQ